MASFYDSDVVRDLIIEELRRRGRGSQTRLAEAVGVRVQTVNKWVHRQTSPEPDKWEQIEAHFDWEPGRIAEAAGIFQPDYAEKLRAASVEQVVESLKSSGIDPLALMAAIDSALAAAGDRVTGDSLLMVRLPGESGGDLEVAIWPPDSDTALVVSWTNEQFAQAASGGLPTEEGPTQNRPSPEPEPEGP